MVRGALALDIRPRRHRPFFARINFIVAGAMYRRHRVSAARLVMPGICLGARRIVIRAQYQPYQRPSRSNAYRLLPHRARPLSVISRISTRRGIMCLSGLSSNAQN